MARTPSRRGNRCIVTSYIDPDQFTALDRIADSQRTSMNALIRRAVDLFLRENSSDIPMTPDTIRREQNGKAA